MKDRQPTQVLANGAIRYGIYNADGTLDHYEYMKREDAPTVEGTPLNKANLLSDATEAKIWRGNDKPEEPTVNDALNKLADGTAKIGDIEITARTDLSAAWLPCDGRTVSQEEYPALCAVLRTPASPSLWTQKTVSTSVGAGGDAISYENGHWFRTYQDATSAHILVSDDGETWTEWPIPQNFWVNSSILSSRVVAAHAVKYFGGLYVCSVCVLCAKSSGVAYYRGVIFASEIFGQFQVDAPSVWYPTYSSIIEKFAAKSEYDVYWDGQRFFVLGTYNNTYDIYPTIRYTNQLTDKSSPVEEDSQAWTEGAMTNFNPIGMCVRKSDGMIVCLGWDAGVSSSSGNYLTEVYYAKTVASKFSRAVIYAWTADLYDDFSDFVETDEGIYVTCNDTSAVKKITGDSSLTVTTVTNENLFDHAINCNGQLVAVRGSTVNVTENIEQGWDYTTTLSAEGKQPIAVGTIVRIPLSSSNATVTDVLHNFAYDNKKIPAITTDTRSKAYIKALEE